MRFRRAFARVIPGRAPAIARLAKTVVGVARARPAKRWGAFRRVIAVLLSSLALLPVLVGARAFRNEYASFRDPPAPVDHERAHARLPNLVEVAFPSPAGQLRGWFVPGRERAAVVLLHGSGGNRAELLPELEILSHAGFSGLAIDWPGQGESAGVVQWGENELTALRAAVDWLEARPEVDRGRIGAFGFSLGSWIVLREAVTDTRLRAVALAGAPASMVDFCLADAPGGGRLAGWASIFAMRARGMRVGTDEPAQIVRKLAPRSLLVIAGGEDTTVPPAMSRALFDGAAEPKELLVIPNARHGQYAEKGREAYANGLTSFFENALRGDR